MRSIIAAALLFAAFSVLAAPANYGGHWTLDKAQSKNLPPYYERISEHALQITQDAATLGIAATISSPQHDPDTFNFNYKLDGSPVNTKTRVRTPAGPAEVPTVLKAEPQANGDMRITIEREMTMPDGNVIKLTTVEQWKLDAAGKVLTIERADDTPRGRMESTMVFVRG